MKLSRIFLILFILGASKSLWANDLSVLKPLIQQHEKGSTQIGIHVYSLTEGKEVFAYKADVPLNPASNAKIITSAVALSRLGVNYRYLTKIYSDGAPVLGQISNLYVVGAGDPSIVEERLWRMAKDVTMRGIQKITGDIVIDQSYFDSLGDNGLSDQDETRAYHAKNTAMAVSYNSFAIVVKPTNPGEPAIVTLDPPCDYFVLRSMVKTGGKGGIVIDRQFESGHEVVWVKGQINGTKEAVFYRNVTSPTLYIGSALKLFLKQNGVEVKGEVREGSALGHYLILEDESKPLSLITRDLNKYSNNFTAEMILKTVGAAMYGPPGTMPKGVKVMEDYLTRLGIPSTDYHLVNGSGLSRENRIAPRVLTAVLVNMYRQLAVEPDYLASLAISGVDGTARKRFKQEDLYSKMRVKTGTLNDVSSLAGFIETKSKHLLAFALISQGSGAGGLHDLQEKVALRLAEY